ncbi:hypothetical protein, variant 1 [Saprolegnia diclina VS20]|uniref:Uncharacterized protein n=1 Tax=Saprolegnia diclina (strain VS20) TaxID=1156394 RepID=T0QUT0_SAPDV|nr:hypothetical protein, variant 1 [Saprolegnia diclina VS20]EQC38421.1 hypothetical protein, variant 1 [Saprolegnia diclina VS20]|eukprot:XP_008608013.1 hypothetical protein, variant 1 [Saprolegnia diclina VS20]
MDARWSSGRWSVGSVRRPRPTKHVHVDAVKKRPAKPHVDDRVPSPQTSRPTTIPTREMLIQQEMEACAALLGDFEEDEVQAFPNFQLLPMAVAPVVIPRTPPSTTEAKQPLRAIAVTKPPQSTQYPRISTSRSEQTRNVVLPRPRAVIDQKPSKLQSTPSSTNKAFHATRLARAAPSARRSDASPAPFMSQPMAPATSAHQGPGVAPSHDILRDIKYEVAHHSRTVHTVRRARWLETKLNAKLFDDIACVLT